MTNAIKYLAGVSVIALAGLALSSNMERNALFGTNNPTEYKLAISSTGNEIPLGHSWFTFSTGHNRQWWHVDDFYRITVETERDKSYFPALQSDVIGHLVRETHFISNGPEERRRFYLRELAGREYIAKPDVALSLVQSLWDEGGPIDTELYNLSQGVETNNRIYLGEDVFATHYDMFAKTYQALDRLGDVD